MSRSVIITDLEIHNFKGIRSQSVKFDKKVTEISGRNATGKTTIADAFTWLLWGLNSDNQQTNKFGIKPNDADGNPIMELNPEVAGTLEITDRETGEIITRRFRRKWVAVFRTRKGETEKEFVKNQGEYYIDDMPVKESEYKAAVETILPPGIFKSITNPFYFPELHWKDKREILIEMAGDVSKQEIASREPAFEKLLADINGTTLEAFAKNISTKIARINTELAQIPVRIEEASREIPETPDYQALESEKTVIQEKLKRIDAIATSQTEASKAAREEHKNKTRQLLTLKDRQLAVITDAKRQAWAEAEEANSARRTLEQELKNAQLKRIQETARINGEIQTQEQLIKIKENQVKQLQESQEQLRQEWWKKYESQYPTDLEALICPVTGALCADETTCRKHAMQYNELKADFDTAKTKALEEMTAQGKELQAQIDACFKEISDAEDKANAAGKEKATLEASGEIAALEFKLSMTPEEVKPREINPEDIPTWREIQLQIEAIDAELQQSHDTPAADIDTTEKDQLQERLAEINQKLGVKTLIEKQNKRIAELNEVEEILMQNRADLQKQEAVCERFSKAYMSEVEAKVNRHFKLVRFQMFEPTATTGDEKPDCVCWVGEAKYNDKNHAGKINAGLDIINAFCRYHGVTAPIFIDNAESVNKFIETESQQVLLKVSEGELIIK